MLQDTPLRDSHNNQIKATIMLSYQEHLVFGQSLPTTSFHCYLPLQHMDQLWYWLALGSMPGQSY